MLGDFTSLFKKKGFVRLVFLYSFWGLIFLAGILVLDPVERQRIMIDQSREEKTQQVIRSIDAFYKFTGRLPWTDDLGSAQSSTPLNWTLVSDPLVGICVDSTCTQGELSDITASVEGVLDITTKDKIYVGKGAGRLDPVYTCFMPRSKKYRKETGKLVDINIDKRVAPTPVLPSCSDRVTWEEDDICFRCASNSIVSD